jgi:hypothetical protein
MILLMSIFFSYSGMEPFTIAVWSNLYIILEHLNLWIVGLNHNARMYVSVVLYCVILCDRGSAMGCTSLRYTESYQRLKVSELQN